MKKKIMLLPIPFLLVVVISATLTPVFAVQSPNEEVKTTFLIVTGGDACHADGAFRWVHMNFKELDSEKKIFTSKIEISSFFFQIENGIVGQGSVNEEIEGYTKDLPIKLKDVKNSIYCYDGTQWADEKFDFKLINNSTGNPNLPPI